MDVIKQLYENQSFAIEKIGKRAYNLLQMERIYLNDYRSFVAIEHPHYSKWDCNEILAAKRIGKYIYNNYKKNVYIGGFAFILNGKIYNNI